MWKREGEEGFGDWGSKKEGGEGIEEWMMDGEKNKRNENIVR